MQIARGPAFVRPQTGAPASVESLEFPGPFDIIISSFLRYPFDFPRENFLNMCPQDVLGIQFCSANI